MTKLNIRIVDAPSNSKLAVPPFCDIRRNGETIPNPRGLWGKSGGVIEISEGEQCTLEVGATYWVGTGMNKRRVKSSEKIDVSVGRYTLIQDQSQHFTFEIKEVE